MRREGPKPAPCTRLLAAVPPHPGDRKDELAEQRLEGARETPQFEAIFKALADLYFRVSADGTIRDWRAGPTADM